jgi:hypothetical protein
VEGENREVRRYDYGGGKPQRDGNQLFTGTDGLYGRDIRAVA